MRNHKLQEAQKHLQASDSVKANKGDPPSAKQNHETLKVKLISGETPLGSVDTDSLFFVQHQERFDSTRLTRGQITS